MIVSLIILTMISHLISKRIRASPLNALDRSIGLVFGLSLGFLVVSMLYIGLISLGSFPKEVTNQPRWIQEAKSRPLVEWGARQLQALAPEGWLTVQIIPDTPTNTIQKRFEKLMTPETKTPVSKTKNGYNKKERREMDRLIKGQQ